MSELDNDHLPFVEPRDDGLGPLDEALVDEGEHDAPFDIADLPRQLLTADPHTQNDVHVALYPHQPAPDLDYVRLFNTHRIRSINIHSLCQLHEQGRFKTAISLLTTRHRLKVDEQYHVDSHTPDVVPRVGPHFLDYTLYVGSRRGLDAALPNVHVDHNWTVKLQLSMTHRLWPDNAVNALPFNPKGRMMYLGTRLDDQLWLAMVPNQYFDLNDPDNTAEKLPRLDYKHPALSPQHAKMLVMFLAHILAEMRHEDITCTVPYPEPLTWHTIRQSTEVMGHLFGQWQRTINLRLPDLRRLHQGFRTSWHAWVAAAPHSWKQDTFLTQNSPVGITLRYGQNQPVMVTRSLDADRLNWDRDRNYSNIRQVSFSLATHISYLDVHHWRTIPEESITRVNPVLYDKPDDDPSRLPVDLHDLPLLDDDGFEINIYNEAGYRVPRRSPSTFDTCGALLDLRRVHELYQGDEDAYGHVQNEVPYTVYPLAFTGNLGNVKASGIMPKFAGRVAQIDKGISRHREDVDTPELEYDPDDDHLPLHRRSPALHGISSQIYNSLSHRVRTEAKFHVVQLGMVTSALAGTTATTVSGRRHWNRRVEFCDHGLPHLRYAEKVSGDGQPQTLRFENTYVLDVSKLRPEFRNGSSIYDRVICPLLKTWSHPSIVSPIRDVLVAFRPNFIPELFKCATYPITALIDLFWEKHVDDVKEKKLMDPCTIEFVSMLERTLNYAHTGNAAVLCKRLMDRTWLSLGLIHDGFPCLSNAFIAHGSLTNGQLTVRADGWPTDPSTHRPLTSSRRCQELTYGSDHYKVYEARFAISFAIDNMPLDAYPSISDMSLRIACYAAEVSLRVYFDDVKRFIQDKMNIILSPNLDDPDRAVRRTARDRLTALSRWVDESNPLSYNAGVLSNLLRALTEPTMGKFELTSSALGQMPITYFAETLVKHSIRTDAQSRPPFIPGGNFLHVARVTIDEIKSIATRAGVSPVSQHPFVVEAFRRACELLKVNHVPWSPNPHHEHGRPSTAVVHDVWLNLGARPSPSPAFSSLRSAEHSVGLLALQASEEIQASDPRGDWSAIDVRLITFASVLHKIKLPIEWDVAHVSRDRVPSYIVDAYHFVANKYDGTKPLHQLATFSAIVCAGLLPSIFPPDLTNHPSLSTQFETYIRDLDWVKRERRKGTTHTGPFITMVIGFIISLYDSESPIMQAVRARSDLKHWWSKHTAKAINAFLLVRLGLANVLTGSGFRSAKWLQDVQPLPMTTIEQKHAEVVRLLKSGGKYGGFDAVRFLVGPKAAEVLAANHYVCARALPPPPRHLSPPRPYSESDVHEMWDF
ncbi:hypothetical protein EDD15DRAFT_2195367 [Pisolithus albus]|nr:hypothetical protein EDD15DRAFT_2195367 [Pisolithus albus]